MNRWCFRTWSGKNDCFGHNLSRSARIEPSFCTVAKLEELNNFYLDCFESYLTKNASFESPGYLARARARAHGPPPQGAGGPPARFAKVSKYFSLCARAHRSINFFYSRQPGPLHLSRGLIVLRRFYYWKTDRLNAIWRHFTISKWASYKLKFSVFSRGLL